MRLDWRATDVRGGDLFRVYRAAAENGSGHNASFQLIATLPGDPGQNDYVWFDGTADRAGDYAYRLGLVREGLESSSQAVQILGVAPRFALHGNQPNPFNPHTVIRFELPERASTTLDIFHVRGHHVRRLVYGMFDAGPRSAQWDGTDDRGRPVPSGLYLYRLTSGRYTASQRMLLLR